MNNLLRLKKGIEWDLTFWLCLLLGKLQGEIKVQAQLIIFGEYFFGEIQRNKGRFGSITSIGNFLSKFVQNELMLFLTVDFGGFRNHKYNK
jgi:hypothetical protein